MFDEFLDEIVQNLFSLFGPWSEHMEQTTWSLEGPATLLKARTRNGSITVRSGDHEGITVVASTTVRGPTEGLAEAFAERVRVYVTQVEEAAYVQAVYPAPPLATSVFVHYEIQVPRAIDVDAYAENGGVHIAGIEGAVEAETWSGNIQVEDGLGPVTLYASNGTIRVADVEGTVDARSGNGSVELRGVTGHTRLWTTRGDVTIFQTEGSVKVTSHTGNIRLEGGRGGAELETVAGDVWASLTRLSKPGTFRTQLGGIQCQVEEVTAPLTAESVKGTVEVVVPAELNGWLRADSERGTIHCELPLIEETTPTHRLQGRLGQGGDIVLDLSTVEGDVRIGPLGNPRVQSHPKGDPAR